MRELHTCEICGQELPSGHLYHFDGQEICAVCLEDNTLLCSHCGERIWASDKAQALTTQPAAYGCI